MPKSKRDRTVALSKVSKKRGRERKETVVRAIRDYVDKFARVFVFTYGNMRNDAMGAMRKELHDCKILLCKRSLMAVALGRSASESHAKNSHKLSRYLGANCGLLCTDRPAAQLVKHLRSYTAECYARPGQVATKTVTLCEGPLYQFAFSMEPQLRKLGLQTKLDKGTVHLLSDCRVCTAGEPIGAEQAKILRLLGMRLSTFDIRPVCCWNKADGKFRRIAGAEAARAKRGADERAAGASTADQRADGGGGEPVHTI